MGQNSRRARTLESAIGIIYLFHLVIVVAALLVIQSCFDMSKFGVSQAAAAGEKYASEAGSTNDTTTGFSPAGKAETYDTDNLYEKIDGKAPMYQDTGFVKLTTQRFASDANSELGFEQCLYDMGNTRNAFSVYSRQKRADVVELPDLDAKGFSYKTTNSIYVSHGQYYIEMVGFAESAELIDAMSGIAQKLIAQLPVDEKDEISEIEIFPPEIVQGSVQLQIIDAYGFDGLTNTWSAKYKVNDRVVTIFFSKRSNADEAKKVAKSYYNFLMSNGAKLVDTNGITPNIKLGAYEDNTPVLDFSGGTEIVFAAGSFVGGVHEADDRDAAEKAAEVLLRRLQSINGETKDFGGAPDNHIRGQASPALH
jgi:hypothetical protein